MEIKLNNNIIIQNAETKHFLADSYFPADGKNLPLVIFAHGYKGFKDWGTWDLVAKKIAQAGFYFVKFNFSHNGTTFEEQSHFADLEAFGQNNFSKELSDYKAVLDYFIQQPEIDPTKVSLIGHSRGGGVSIILTAEDIRIKKLITWASVSNFDRRYPLNVDVEEWKKSGVIFTENQRTKQQMPHYYQMFEDFQVHKDRFSVENAAKKINIPVLLIHGMGDEAVSYNQGEKLHSYIQNSELELISDANHTFGAKEPWEEANLPTDLEIVVEKTIKFLQNDKE